MIKFTDKNTLYDYLYNMTDSILIANIIEKTSSITICDTASCKEYTGTYEVLLEVAKERGLIHEFTTPFEITKRYSINTDFLDVLRDTINDEVEKRVKERMKEITIERCADLIKDAIVKNITIEDEKNDN